MRGGDSSRLPLYYSPSELQITCPRMATPCSSYQHKDINNIRLTARTDVHSGWECPLTARRKGVPERKHLVWGMS